MLRICWEILLSGWAPISTHAFPSLSIIGREMMVENRAYIWCDKCQACTEHNISNYGRYRICQQCGTCWLIRDGKPPLEVIALRHGGPERHIG